MAQQLFIRGMAVDMPADEIKINVASNLFSDADKIKTAHSYNVALPRTANNDSIFALAFLPASVTEQVSTHCYLPASLFVDGVPLFEQGQAVLTSVSDKGYNLSLFFGLLGIFDAIKREGLDLCDLPASVYWDESRSRWVYLTQYDDQLPQYTSGITSEDYSGLDNAGKELADAYPWILPSVPTSRVLADALGVYGLTLQLSTEASARIDLLWHPLTTRRAMAKGESLIVNGVVQMRHMGSGKYEPSFIQPTADSSHPNNIIFASLPIPDHPSQYNHSATNNYIANDLLSIKLGQQYASISHMDAEGDFKVTKVKIWGTLPYQGTIIIPNLNERKITGTPQSGNYVYDVEITSEFNCSRGDVVVNIADEWGDPPTTQQAGTLNVQLTIEDGDNVCISRPWEYIRNYPNMTLTKYLGEVLAHIGGCIVGSVNKPNTLTISTFDEVMQTQPQSCDLLGLNTITMTLAGQAQKNTYTHEKNEDNGGEYTAEGVIYTNDATLALERTAFSSKFKVPIRGIVRLWQVSKGEGKDDKDKLEWVAKGNYIASNLDGYISNFNQDFKTAIADYYTNFERLVAVPKVIEAVVRLSVVDLLNFDLGRPVYFEQLGRQYLIESVESDQGEQYKLKLIQL